MMRGEKRHDTSEIVQRTKFQYPGNSKSLVMAEEPKHTKVSLPRLQAIQRQSEAYCSAEICDFALGTKPCPFLQGRCRSCTEFYSKDHKVYGRCAHARMDTINIDGAEFRRVPLANRGGNRETTGGGKGCSEYKNCYSKETRREPKPRTTLNQHTKHQISSIPKSTTETDTSLPPPANVLT